MMLIKKLFKFKTKLIRFSLKKYSPLYIIQRNVSLPYCFSKKLETDRPIVISHDDFCDGVDNNTFSNILSNNRVVVSTLIHPPL